MYWQVGDFNFDAATNVLEGGSGRQRLEPKPAALLKYFAQNPGRDISRDDLIEKVWGGQIVTDGAINRVVVQLRKALGDNHKIKKYIVTVPKVGYRLAAPVSAGRPPPPPKPRKWQAGFMGGLAVIAALFVVFLSVTSPSDNAGGDRSLSPLVRQAGEQFGAAVSPDGTKTAVSIRTDQGADLYIADNTTGTLRAIGVSGAWATSVTWHPNGTALAYQYRDNDRCFIYVVSLSAGTPAAPQPIYECALAGQMVLAFNQDGTQLYFTERTGPYEPAAVFAFDLALNSKRRLSQPLAAGRGNHFVSVGSKQGRALLLSDRQAGQTTAFELNIDTNSFERLIQWPFRVDQAVWGQQPGTVVHPDMHPSYQLMETSYLTNESRVLVSDSRRIKEPQLTSDGYIFTSYLHNRDIWLNGELPLSLNSSVMDYSPAVSRDEARLAFVSKRSGDSMVWIQDQASGALRRFALAKKGISVVSLDWSFDDSSLLVVTSQGLHILDADTGETTRIIETALPAYGASWVGIGQLSYSLREDGFWRRYDVDLSKNDVSASKGTEAFMLASRQMTVFVDQSGAAHTEAGQRLVANCKPMLAGRYFTYSVRNSSFYCIAAEAEGMLLKVSSNNKIDRIHAGQGAILQYSVSGEQVAHVELTSSVSDIMLTTDIN